MTRLSALALLAALALPVLAPPVSAQDGPGLDADASPLDPDGTPQSFGSAIAVDGGFAIVGAPSANEAYVFQRIDGEWTLEQTLSGNQSDTSFGSAVAMDGNRLVVGAPRQRFGAASTPGGAAHVYVRSGAGGGSPWSREEIIAVPGEITDGQRRFGGAVAIRNSRVFVGDVNAIVRAGANGSQRRRSGSVFVFTRTGTIVRQSSGGQVWPLTATISLGDFSREGDEFGASVSADGPYVLVGSPGRPAFVAERRAGGTVTGQAYLYLRNGADWDLDTGLTGSTASDGDRFGESVALDVSATAATAVVGAPRDRGDEQGQGSITVFEGPEGNWVERAVLHADPVIGSNLGAEVAVSGNRIVGGGISSSDGFGATAFVFDKRNDTWTYQGALREPQTIIVREARGENPLGGVAVGDDVVMLGVRSRSAAYAFGNVRPVANEGSPTSALALDAPRPNPTTGRATLTLTVDTPQTVRATLVDALGRRVQTLWDGPASGPLHLGVEAGGLAPGVYAVHVEGEAASAVRRLTVVR